MRELYLLRIYMCNLVCYLFYYQNSLIFIWKWFIFEILRPIHECYYVILLFYIIIFEIILKNDK